MRPCDSELLVQAIGPAEIGNGLGRLAGVQEHFAAEREPFDVVGIGSQAACRFLPRGIDLVIEFQTVQPLRNHPAAIADQVAGHAHVPAGLGGRKHLARLQIDGHHLAAAERHEVLPAGITAVAANAGPGGHVDGAAAPGLAAVFQVDGVDRVAADQHHHPLVDAGDVIVLAARLRDAPAGLPSARFRQ